MAKQPEHRFQTPAALIEALLTGDVGEISEESSRAVTVAMAKASSAADDAKTGTEDTAAIWSSLATSPESIVPKRQALSGSSVHFKPNKTLFYAGGGTLGLGVVILILWLLIGRGSTHVSDTPETARNESAATPVAKHEDPPGKPSVSPAALEQVKEVVQMLRKLNPAYDGTHKPTFENDAVIGLEFPSDKVADLTPLKSLPKLKYLTCKGKPAAVNLLTDLTPLKGLALEALDIRYTQVSDLKPLQGMPLKKLQVSSTPIANIEALRGLALAEFACKNTEILDLAPVREMPLQQLSLDFKLWRDQPILQGIKTLQTINDVPASAFWAKAAAAQAEFEQWSAKVAGVPWPKQVEEVREEMKRRNPGFDGKLEPFIVNNAVAELTFLSDEIKDISPVRALTALMKLNCQGSAPGKGKLTDLGPLTGLRLTVLFCSNTHVAELSPLRSLPLTQLMANSTPIADLTPLRGMPLTLLSVQATKIKDIGPLAGMPLKTLRIGQTAVADLSPLTGMALDTLGCPGTPVSNLTPLQKLPLKYLNVANTKVTDLIALQGVPLEELILVNARLSDLTPLQNIPLKKIQFNFNPWRDADALRAIKTLVTINNQPKEVVWKARDAFDAWCKEVAAMKPDDQEMAVVAELKKRNPGFDSPVTRQDFKGVITVFEFPTDKVVDIAPVRALPALKRLSIAGSGPGKGVLADIWPLKGLSIVYLNADNTRVADLTPLRALPLEYLYLSGAPVLNLNPIRGLSLKEIGWDKFQPQRDLTILRSFATLQKINGEPAAEFLDKATAKKGE